MRRILIIKHGALGDIVLATPGFKAIREAYPDAHITCLTSRSFAPLLRPCPWFDAIEIDAKPRFFQLLKLWRLMRILNNVIARNASDEAIQIHSQKKNSGLLRFVRNDNTAFHAIFDLQTSTRSSFYWHLLRRPKPMFSGVNPRASHSYTDPARHGRHAHENLQRQLAIAGIHNVSEPDISWLAEEIALPPTPYTLLVPGGAAHRPQKRWPAEHYAQLAAQLSNPVLIGTEAEREVLEAITSAVPQAINLCGKTSIAQLATLARGAQCAVGNDTGPMHVIAAAGCPSLVLFSADSSPERSAPVGSHVRTIQRDDLKDLRVEEVLQRLDIPPHSQFTA